MNDKILDEEYVKNHGVDSDNGLGAQPPYGDYLTTSEDGRDLFNGLAYEMFENGRIANYSWYKDGVEDGQFVLFYPDGKVKTIMNKKRGVVHGKMTKYFPDGKLEEEGEYELGVALNYTCYDENGKVVDEKMQPSASDLEYIKKLKEALEK
ncbi:toxin-antitoxin system YwqK family antitoxin [Enterococcus sp. LJL51]|uniref:toxin-antitoxin system YwqK family antitoxin n=1 Tax=Enterococcus sp. LJL51 TaxID=3416656 RepID=UPI003CF8790F